jgi:hypothetical protein
MNNLLKTLATVAVTVLAIWGLGHFAIRSYRNAVIHSHANQTEAATATSDRPAPANNGTPAASTLFEGDLFAQIHKATGPRSTAAEDEQRARQAATWVRVVFEEGSHPRFAELVKSALLKHWNSHLGYQLVFEESRGPLEEAATAVALRAKVATYTAPFQQGNQPEVLQFFRAVDLIVYKNPRAVSTSWDMMTFAAEKMLPQHFSLSPGQAETFNRQRLGELYAEFGKKLEGVPAFSFLPEADFDAIRELYTWPLGVSPDHPAADPLVFSQTAERLVKNYNRPLYKGYLDAMCIHLLDVNATAYVDGITKVLSEWLPHVPPERLQILRSHLGFGDYTMMKALLAHRQGYLLFKTLPEVWTDPVLGEFSRNYWRDKQNSPQLGWMAREFADKLKAPAEPPRTPHILIVSAPQKAGTPAAPAGNGPQSPQGSARVPPQEQPASGHN